MQVTIRSNTNPHTLYTVHLNAKGNATRCTCLAGQHGRMCCHRERAELAESFLAAQRLLKAMGMPRRVFLEKFRTTVRAYRGHGNKAVNVAIRKTIAYAAERAARTAGRKNRV